MGKEDLPEHAATPPSAYQPQQLFREDGTPNRRKFFETFGLGREIDRVIEFGDWKGPAHQMLGDSRCPVGEQLATAFQQGGIARVEEQLTAINMLDEKFKLPISDETRKRHEQRKPKT